MISENLTALRTLWFHYYGLFGAYAGLLLAYRIQKASPIPRSALRLWWRWYSRPKPAPGTAQRTPASDEVGGLDPQWLAARFPSAREQKLEAAERIGRHEFDFLGTGFTQWGDPIDWHRDVKSGYQWPVKFYANYRPEELTPGNGVDVKVPWELSRLHHLVTLAQAWYLTRDPRHADEFVSQWESWLASNPSLYGVNWTSAMEVAIRAVNLLWARSLLENAPIWTAERRSTLDASLRQHGLFIEHNLEVGVRQGRIVAANHYLANMCGLACLGLAHPTLPEAARWRSTGVKALEQEIRRQVLDDGFFYESSTSYHRFAIELLLVPALLARRAGAEMSSEYWTRLEKMMNVVLHISAPDGRVPQIGDNDDGRLLILSDYPYWSRHDHRYLLAAGAALLERGDFKAAAGDSVEEVFWLLGRHGVDRFDSLEADGRPLESHALPDAGLYVIRGDDGQDYALVRAGSPAPHAPTAHAHNDALSLELWVDGEPVFVDPGTYCYTSDLETRDRFRSTAAHNTVIFDGGEANTIRPGQPFLIGRGARTRVIDWRDGADRTEIVAESYGNEVPGHNVHHRRTVRYSVADAEWSVIDELSANGELTAEVRWHGPPETPIHVDEIGEAREHVGFTLSHAEVGLDAPSSAIAWSHRVERTDYSPGYGVSLPADCFVVSLTFRDRCALSWTVREHRQSDERQDHIMNAPVMRSAG